MLKRYLPLLIIVSSLSAFFIFGGSQFVTLDALRENEGVLKAFVAKNFILAFFGFIFIYAVLVSISVPGAGFLSIFSGFLFGVIPGTIAAVIAATIGATVIFLVARTAFGSGLASRAGPYAQKFEAGLKKNELSYLFILRLLPVFPFFIVNIVPALFGVKTRNYVLSTMFGIIPGGLIYVSVGNGIGDILHSEQELPLTGIMSRPAVILPIIGLIILSLIPVVYKSIKKGD